MLHVSGPVDAHSGWVMDFADLRTAFQPLFERLDHRCLNDVAGLENPTSENLAKWVWRELKPGLPQLTKITVHETCTSGVRGGMRLRGRRTEAVATTAGP